MSVFGNTVPTQFNKTDSGFIPAGFSKIGFVNKGATNITVGTRTYPPGKGECWCAVENNPFGKVAYNANGGLIWFTCMKVA